MCIKAAIKVFFIALSLNYLCTGCGEAPIPPTVLWNTQEICGRDKGSSTERESIYRAKIPQNWIRRDPASDESIVDTTKALCEFVIAEETGQIRITIHNFPFNQMQDRIPPAAQIARWRRQFDSLDAATLRMTPQAYAGFVGMNFEGTGILKGQTNTVMGWSMQLAPEHYQSLSKSNSLSEQKQREQMRADFTIKAVGDPLLVAKHRDQIEKFARSFELIQEIPL